MEEHKRDLEGRDEMNLAEFPIATIGRNYRKEVLEFSGEYRDKAGNKHDQRWVVRSGAGLGLPTEFAERVLVALIAITAEDDFREKHVEFTTYRILKILGWDINRRNYRAVDKALKQLANITIESENAFYDKKTGKRITTVNAFNIIDSFHLSYEDDPFADEDMEIGSHLIWGNVIWRSFKAGYIKKLDLDFYLGLKNPIARRLYRFLDKRMAYQDEYQIDIFVLSKFLGLSENYKYPSELKRKLKPAFDELLKEEFLEDVEVFKMGKFTRVRFAKISHKVDQLPLWEEPETKEENTGKTGKKKPEQELWDKVLKDLSFQVQENTFRTYLERTELISIEDNTATILAGQASDWLQNRMESKVKLAINLNSDKDIQTVIFVQEL
ncbi:replication initiator protein A [Chloroflexi bacterium TSY]|nr:replication initiator protein A [Chloroflexi bacterium TSY]